LGYEGIPKMSRPTFRHELIGQTFAAVGSAGMLPALIQLFALKSLAWPDWVAPVLLVEAPLGNLFATFISQYLERRRRIPLLVAARVGMAVMFLLIALLPLRPESVWPYALLLVPPALLAAASMSIQSSIRHSNYSDRVRGSVLSRLIIIRMGLDQWPAAHHAIYPICAAAMIASALAYRGIRVRRESRLLRKGRSNPPDLFRGVRVLVKDRAFGLFMLFQMLSGAANLMVTPAIVLWLNESWKVSYSKGTDALVFVPWGVALLGLPLAGKLFDRMGICRFRSAGAMAWTLGRIVLFIGAVKMSWPLVLIAFALQGLGFSSGSLAWNIGHMRFTSPENSQTYMGIHLTLQGVRGLTMPFLGTWLYRLPAVGVNLFLAAAAMHLAAAVGFLLMRPPKLEQRILLERPEPFATRAGSL